MYIRVSVGPGEQDSLAKDLQVIVSKHNEEFEAELAAWDLARQRPPQLQLSSQPTTEKREGDGSALAVVPSAPNVKDWNEPAASAGLSPAVEMEEIPVHSLSTRLDSLVQSKCLELLSYRANAFTDNRYLRVETYCLRSGAPEYFCHLLALNTILGELEGDKKDSK